MQDYPLETVAIFDADLPREKMPFFLLFATIGRNRETDRGYGEPHNDWLRLDVCGVNNPTMRLSNNPILGFVLISAHWNPELRDQTNREGLMESQAADDHRRCETLFSRRVS